MAEGVSVRKRVAVGGLALGLALVALLLLKTVDMASSQVSGATPLYFPLVVMLATPTPTATQDRSGCDPAYPDPDTCFPSPPPDLYCADVAPLHNFTVLPPDPHGFDADHDGIGCESF